MPIYWLRQHYVEGRLEGPALECWVEAADAEDARERAEAAGIRFAAPCDAPFGAVERWSPPVEAEAESWADLRLRPHSPLASCLAQAHGIPHYALLTREGRLWTTNDYAELAALVRTLAERP